MTDTFRYRDRVRSGVRLSIRTKVALVISLFVVLLSSFLGAYVPAVIDRQAVSAAVKHTRDLTLLTADGLAGPLMRRDHVDASVVLRRLENAARISYAGVVDGAETPIVWVGEAVDPRGSHRRMNTDDLSIHDPIVRSSLDVIRDGRYLGTLFIGFDLTEERITVERIVLAIRIGSIGLLVLGILAAVIASEWLVRPLTSLVETMSRVASGDLSVRADESPGGEFGTLASSFNRMVDRWNEATAQLTSSEGRFRTLVENLSEGVTMDSPDETVIYSNRAADEIFGVESGTLVHRRYTDFLEPEQLPVLTREQAIRRAGNQSTYEMDIRRPDGCRRTLMVTATPRFDADGEFLGSFCVCRDITDRKLNEIRLRESEDRLRLALDAAQMGIWSWDFESNRMVWSEQLEHVFGLAPGTFSGDPEEYLRRIPGEEQRRARRTLYDALYGWSKDLHTIVHRITRTDGALRWVEMRGKLYRDEQGKPVRMAGTMVDITHRRLTEGAIEAIVRGTATTTGREFFQDLVRELSRALGVRMAYVARVVPGDERRLRTLGVADNGNVATGFERSLEGTPCEQVFDRKATMYTAHVRELFPRDRLLRDLAAESYFGVPLNSSTNEPLGVMAVVGVRPMDDTDIVSSIMTVFGARAAAELERLKVEEHVTMLAHAITSVPESITIEDMAGKLIYANDAFETTYGYGKAEALGREATGLLAAEGRTAGRHLRMSDHSPLRGEEVHRRKDGRHIPVHVSTSVIAGEKGEARARVTIATDLTGSKKAEEQLRATSQTLRTILEVSPLAILLLREDRTIEFWNRAAEQMFGWSADEVIGKPVPFVPAVVMDETERLQDLISRGGSATNVESKRLRKDGSILDVSISATGIPDASGKIVRMMGILTDITERKRAEAEVRKLSVAVEQSQISIVITDRTGAIEYVNPFFTRATGYSREEAIGQNPRILKSGETATAVYDQMWQTLTSGREWRGELHNRRKNGELFWEYASISPVRDDAGVTTHYLAVKEDITEQKRVDEELKRLNEELERRVAERTAQLEAANSELEAFSYSVSHDLRAPLRHVSGYVEMLREHLQQHLDHSSQRYVDVITSSSKRMGVLIDDLLAFSRLGRTELRRLPVDLDGLVREVIAEMEPDTRDRTVAFTIHPLPVVHADRTLLRQVLMNLVANAVKFTRGRERAVIEVGCQPERDAHGKSVVFVRDNGAGFDMTYADKLFGVFQRLHTAEEFEGTGIGLANVRRIIHRHGGTTWAEGRLDGGATFYFTV